MTDQEFLSRIYTIDEKNTCCHFREIWLDPTYGKKNPGANNPGLVAIMALVKPAGPFGPALAEALENRHQNVCFSIRAITKDYVQQGRRYRVLFTIVTFDWVLEPGIATANKWDSPALEMHKSGLMLPKRPDLQELASGLVTRPKLEEIIRPRQGVGLESSQALALETLEAFKPQTSIKPVYIDW
jgi:hypothetical protein